QATRIIATDLAKDSYLDLVTCTNTGLGGGDDGERTVSLLRNKKAESLPGKFEIVAHAAPPEFRVNTGKSYMAGGDVNGDGCSDVVSVGVDRCGLGDGSHGVTPPRGYLSVLFGDCTLPTQASSDTIHGLREQTLPNGVTLHPGAVDVKSGDF